MHDEQLGCYKWCGNLTCSAMGGGGCLKRKHYTGGGHGGSSFDKIDFNLSGTSYAPNNGGNRFTWTPPPKPIGFWYITSSHSIAVYDKKPDEIHIKNHELLLGWKWKDADDVSNVHETKGTSSGGPS